MSRFLVHCVLSHLY